MFQGLYRAHNAFFGFFQYLWHPVILILRIHWGWLFFAAGFKKLGALDQTIGFFGSLGIPFPEIMVYVVAIIELVGGLMLLFGFGSRIASFWLAAVMIGAYATADLSAVMSVGQGFVDWFNNIIAWNAPAVYAATPFSGLVDSSPFFFLLTSLIVMMFGPGFFSIDTFAARGEE